jgi:hypothetical protein
VSAGPDDISAATRPIALREPVAVTTAHPRPRTTTVPADRTSPGRSGLPDGLVHRHRLPGQRRLIDEQRRGLRHERVGRDDVALGQYEQITDHHIGGRNQPLGTVAQHPRFRRGHRRQRCDRPVGLDLLCHTHRGVDDDDQRDDRGVGPVTSRDGQRGGGQQHQHQRIAQLRQDPPPQLHPVARGKDVRAVGGQPRRRLRRGQAPRRGHHPAPVRDLDRPRTRRHRGAGRPAGHRAPSDSGSHRAELGGAAVVLAPR